MGGVNWGDGGKTIKVTSTAGISAGVNMGGAVGAAVGGLLYFVAYIWMMNDMRGDTLRIPFFPLVGFGLVGFVVGACIGGVLGNIYDKVKDKQNGI